MSLPQQRHYQLEIFTPHHMLAGLVEPFGALMVYLNHPERRTIQLKNATVTALDAMSTVNPFTTDEVWIPRGEVTMIRMLDQVSPETMPLLPVKEKLRVFIPRLVVQAQFSRGQDTKMADIFHSYIGDWVPGTEAHIFSLLNTKSVIAPTAPAVLLSKRYVQFYQPVPEAAS
jgi:hypothetical protein